MRIMAIPKDTYPIEQELCPIGRRRPGVVIAPKVVFIVAHDTGNAGAGAMNHARWYRSDPNPPRDKISSAHLFVDDKKIIETVPALRCDLAEVEQARHVLYNRPNDNRLFGYDANRAAIGIELCFGGSIDPEEAYRRYVWTIALACDRFDLDPAHRVTGHQVLDPGRKIDPGHAPSFSGRSLERLILDVVTLHKSSGSMLPGSARPVLGPAQATVRLHLRNLPSLDGKRVAILEPGTEVEVEDVVQGDVVAGIADWCRLKDGYCWGGGIVFA